MGNALQNLSEAVEAWRTTRVEAPVRVAESNPYGAKIYQMNLDWAEVKRQHAEALEARRIQYQEQVDRLHELSARWRADHPVPKGGRGRPRIEHSDDVKRAAAQAVLEGENRTVVRALLGISSTERLNTILAEGQALLEREGQR
jgi:hypothetical protein